MSDAATVYCTYCDKPITGTAHYTWAQRAFDSVERAFCSACVERLERTLRKKPVFERTVNLGDPTLPPPP